jgi:outer membrane lipoprotein SlyB
MSLHIDMAEDVQLTGVRNIYMRLSLVTALLSIASFVPSAPAATTYYSRTHRTHPTVYRGRHHIRKTVKRVGVGAAGGAAVGALAGGGTGAAIGAAAGGGAGAIYDRHEKRRGR